MKLKSSVQQSFSNKMDKTKYFYLIFFLFLNLITLPVKSDPIFEMGKTIFLGQGNCAVCHVLTDRDVWHVNPFWGKYNEHGRPLQKEAPFKVIPHPEDFD